MNLEDKTYCCQAILKYCDLSGLLTSQRVSKQFYRHSWNVLQLKSFSLAFLREFLDQQYIETFENLQELTLLLSRDQRIPDQKCGIIDTLKSFHFQCTKSQFLKLMQ